MKTLLNVVRNLNFEASPLRRRVTAALLTGIVLGMVGCAGMGKGSGAGGKAGGEPDLDKSGSSVSEDDDAPNAPTGSVANAAGGGALSGPGANVKPTGGYDGLSKAVRSGRANTIIEEAAKILGTNQYDAVALNTLAMYHFRKNHNGAAKLLLNKALEKNSNSAALYNNIAVVLLDEGDFQGALINFKKALKIDPNHPQANGNIGSLYVQSGDYAKALPLLESAYKQLRATAPGVATNYAVALRANKDYSGAQRIYEEVLKTNSRDVPTILNYAILDIDYMNKPKEGLALVYKVKFIETDKRDIVDRASALEKKAKAAIK